MLLALLAPACALTRRLDPPALIQPECLSADEALERYPPGTERVSLRSPSGAQLSGVFVPADPGAPVVLHLLDSSGSVARRQGGPWGATRELADLGLSSLIVDYTGVGLSQGERSVQNLRGDALACWDEAVQRAGGDPGRVLVRAVSLGTIAAALLLDEGARPAAQVWVLPVFPDTAVPRFARWAYCALAEGFARLFLRPIADVRPDEALRRASVPTLVVTAEEDELTTAVEVARLEAVLPASGGRLRTLAGGHLLVGARARWLLPEELPFLRGLGRPDAGARLARGLAGLPAEIAERFPPGSAAHARLAALAEVQLDLSPEVAAAALSEADPLAAARFLWSVGRRPYPKALTFEERVEALSLADPAGELPIERLEQLSLPSDLLKGFGAIWLHWSADITARMAREIRPDDPDAWYSYTLTAHGVSARAGTDLAELFADLLERTGSDADARRQFARLLLKDGRIPDRVRTDPEGTVRLEAFEDGRWIELDLAPRAAPE